MGNFCELLINVVRRDVLKLLTGTFVAGHPASCTGCVHQIKPPANRQALPQSCDLQGTW